MGLAGPIDLFIAAALAIRRFGLRRVLGAGILLSPLWLWTLPPVPCTSLRPLFRRCAVIRPYQAWVKADLRNLALQQELHRADHGRYATDLQALGFVPSDRLVLTVHATRDGWSAWATHEALEAAQGCAVFVATSAPPSGLGFEGAASGEIVCGTSAPRGLSPPAW